MKSRTVIFSLFITLMTLIVSSSAFADGWAVGHGRIIGNTPEATMMAIASTAQLSVIAAEAAIGTCDEGRVGGNSTGDDTRLELKGNIIKVYTFYSHHGGSCGKTRKAE